MATTTLANGGGERLDLAEELRRQRVDDEREPALAPRPVRLEQAGPQAGREAVRDPELHAPH